MDYAEQYQASDEVVRAAVGQLLETVTAGPAGLAGNVGPASSTAAAVGDNSHTLVGVHLAPGSPYGVIARRTELAVFSESFHETQDTLAHEYAPYEEVSGFFVVIDTSTSLPAGASRYVDGGVELNPTLRDLETIGSMPEVAAELRQLLETHPRAWDMTTTEVHEAYRGHHGGYLAIGLLGRMIVKAAEMYQLPGLSLVASEHSHQTQVATGFPQRLLAEEPLVYPDGVELLVAWADIPAAQGTMLAHLERLRAMADNPTVARELPVLEPLILGVATGAGFDPHIDMTPR